MYWQFGEWRCGRKEGEKKPNQTKKLLHNWTASKICKAKSSLSHYTFSIRWKERWSARNVIYLQSPSNLTSPWLQETLSTPQTVTNSFTRKRTAFFPPGQPHFTLSSLCYPNSTRPCQILINHHKALASPCCAMDTVRPTAEEVKGENTSFFRHWNRW